MPKIVFVDSIPQRCAAYRASLMTTLRGLMPEIDFEVYCPQLPGAQAFRRVEVSGGDVEALMLIAEAASPVLDMVKADVLAGWPKRDPEGRGGPRPKGPQPELRVID